MKSLTTAIVLSALLGFTSSATANTIDSSTMWFVGELTDLGGGVFTGTIEATEGYFYVPGGPGGETHTGGGFDVYGRQGGEAYVQGYYGTGPWNGPSGNDTYNIGYYTSAPHDAYPEPGGPWGSWYNPDVADWNTYSLTFTEDSWSLNYTPTGESPMSGSMSWASMYAVETDLGTQDGGHDGSAAHGGGAAAWDWDCGWGVEVVPLQHPGFEVGIAPLGGGPEADLYEVFLQPSAVPEPGTILLLGVAALGLAGAGARKKFRK
jgi:hypothetical protein